MRFHTGAENVPYLWGTILNISVHVDITRLRRAERYFELSIYIYIYIYGFISQKLYSFANKAKQRKKKTAVYSRNVLNNSTEQSPAEFPSAFPEGLCILWKSQVLFRVQNSPTCVLAMSQIK